MASAYEYALNLLSARAYTARNIRRKLVQKKFDPAEVDAAMERLLASKLIDDARFAAEYARQKLVTGGLSARRVEHDLAKRGISRDVAHQSVGSVVEEESIDTFASAERVARKKMGSLAGLDPDVKRRRIFGFLARRGFDLDEIKRAVNTVISEKDGTDR